MLARNINLWGKLVFGMFICPLSILQGQAYTDHLSAATVAVLFSHTNPAFSEGNNLFMWYHHWTSSGYPWLMQMIIITTLAEGTGIFRVLFWCRPISVWFLSYSSSKLISSYQLFRLPVSLSWDILEETLLLLPFVIFFKKSFHQNLLLHFFPSWREH